MIRWFKNFWGWILGYKDCPSCQDNFYWKEKGYIKIHQEHLSISHPKDESGSISILCKECVSYPLKLDPRKIFSYILKERGRTQEDAFKVYRIVVRFIEKAKFPKAHSTLTAGN